LEENFYASSITSNRLDGPHVGRKKDDVRPGQGEYLAVSDRARVDGGAGDRDENFCSAAIAVIEFHTNFLASSSGVTAWRDTAFFGEQNTLVQPPPAPGAFVVPAGAENGMLATFREWREQWVAASGYTPAIGETLMIVKPEGGETPETEVTPTIQVSAAQTGYTFGIMVSGRAGSDQWKVETRQKGQDWKNAGSFTGKSADITITPLTPGDPEQVEIRVQLRRKNEDYGNLSQIATVTVNP